MRVIFNPTGAIAVTALAVALASPAALGGQQEGQREGKNPQGQQQPQGLYSAQQLLDADVYAADSEEEIGEIEDILFDNDMSIKSFAVQTESDFGLAGKSYVVSPDQISVEAEQGDEATEPEYRIMLDADAEQLRQNPVYSDSWWNQTQKQASQAWDTTKAKASSAWTTIKAGTADLLKETGEAAGEAADKLEGAGAEAGDAAGDAAENTSEATENAAESPGN